MTDELDPNYENAKQIARLNAEIDELKGTTPKPALVGEHFKMRDDELQNDIQRMVSRAIVRKAEIMGDAARKAETLGQRYSHTENNTKPLHEVLSKGEKQLAQPDPTRCVILFNGETNEWEAWEDNSSEPEFTYELMLDVVEHCRQNKYDIIEVHNNA